MVEASHFTTAPSSISTVRLVAYRFNKLRQLRRIRRDPPRTLGMTIKLSAARLIARISLAAGPCKPVGPFPETPYGSFRSGHRL
jgi:hypothetical protein